MLFNRVLENVYRFLSFRYYKIDVLDPFDAVLGGVRERKGEEKTNEYKQHNSISLLVTFVYIFEVTSGFIQYIILF